MRRLVALVTLLLIAASPWGAAPDPVAAPIEREIEMEVTRGIDTNPLELNPGVLPPGTGVPAGASTQLGLAGRLSHQWSPRAGYFLAARGQGRLHASSLEAADTAQGGVEAGLGLVLFSRGERKLSAGLRGAWARDRGTFVDPGTGEVYLAAPASDPNTLVPIPDRFDVDVTAVHLDLRLRTSPRLLMMLDTSLQRQDYVEDYGEAAGLEKLDDRLLVLRPGVRWQMSGRVRLDVSAEWGRRDYDRLSALEEDATLAAGTRRSYRQAAIQTALRVQPSKAWTFSAGVTGSDRRDRHAGYYDSLGSSVFATGAWSPSGTARLALHLSRAGYAFDQATLDNTPNGDLRGGQTMRAAASVERDAGGHVTFFGEAGTLRSDSHDPLYAFRRSWARAGLRLKL